MMNTSTVDGIAAEALAALRVGRQIVPFSKRYSDFTLTDAYRVASLLREKRAASGEHWIGRKIGFTNRAVWAKHGISAPIWGYVYDSTVRHLNEGRGTFSLDGLAEPRIEPEIVFHMAAVPRPEMGDNDLLACIDWVALGFEIVQSIFPGWALGAADAVAAEAVHAALLIGTTLPIGDDRSAWLDALETFSIEMSDNRGVVRSGYGWDVLGSPIKAVRFLLSELARDEAAPPLAPGEIVTTGTLTEAMPVSAGEIWTTIVAGIDLPELRVSLE